VSSDYFTKRKGRRQENVTAEPPLSVLATLSLQNLRNSTPNSLILRMKTCGKSNEPRVIRRCLSIVEVAKHCLFFDIHHRRYRKRNAKMIKNKKYFHESLGRSTKMQFSCSSSYKLDYFGLYFVEKCLLFRCCLCSRFWFANLMSHVGGQVDVGRHRVLS
jgi:hypothetical protein